MTACVFQVCKALFKWLVASSTECRSRTRKGFMCTCLQMFNSHSLQRTRKGGFAHWYIRSENCLTTPLVCFSSELINFFKILDLQKLEKITILRRIVQKSKIGGCYVFHISDPYLLTWFLQLCEDCKLFFQIRQEFISSLTVQSFCSSVCIPHHTMNILLPTSLQQPYNFFLSLFVIVISTNNTPSHYF